jgi:hypothetical protein
MAMLALFLPEEVHFSIEPSKTHETIITWDLALSNKLRQGMFA